MSQTVMMTLSQRQAWRYTHKHTITLFVFVGSHINNVIFLVWAEKNEPFETNRAVILLLKNRIT